MSTTLDTSGIDTLRAGLRRLEDGASRQLLERLGDELLEDITTRIRFEETSAEGGAYRPLSRGYVRRTADPSDFLQDSGRLLASLHALVADDEAVDVGSALPYAAVHQDGSATVPARPFLGIGEDDVGDLELIAATYLDSLLGEAVTRA